MHSNDDLNLLFKEVSGHVGKDTLKMIADISTGAKDKNALRQMERVLALRKDLCHNHMDLNNT